MGFAGISESMEGQVERARAIALETLGNLSRGNGHPFIEHPDNVVRIVTDEIGLPEECRAAVYLHEASRVEKGLLQRIKTEFSGDIYTMVEGLNALSGIRPRDTRLEAENYKKLIISYSRDPRVVVIKIADRLEVMRSLDLFPKPSRERKALETLLLYVPLAHQLGLYNIKSEMEDIYFKYADPEQYRFITNKLSATAAEREKLTREFVEPLRKRLESEGIKYKFKIRTKAAYSIWKKMQVQKVPFEGVYDVFAIRFIVDCDPSDREGEKALCWKVFSLVTEEYESDTGRLRDWLSNPKPNGYESLHITVKNREGAALEVQIRSARMDDIAENGLASHWSYKGIKREDALVSWLNSVRSFLEAGSAVSGSEVMPLSDDVFVFTPSGELRKLPSGATVLDFAFEIHSNLGIRCTGGMVNGKAVPIRERLSTGDYVEILKGKNQKPSADWLNYVVTSKARSRIRSFLKEEEYRKANDGKELLASKCRKWRLEVSDEDLAALMKKYRLKDLGSFYEKVGDGTVDVLDVKKFVELRHAARRVDIQSATQEDVLQDGRTKGGTVSIIGAANLKSLDYKFAQCCRPVYPDDIFGFITRLDGIKIHKISCPNAARLLNDYPYRILRAKWIK